MAFLLSLSCFGTAYSIERKLKTNTGSHIVHEKNNVIKDDNGELELNLHYNKLTQEIVIAFQYTDNNWLFLNEKKSIYFLFADGDIIIISPKENITRNVQKNGPAREIIKESFEALISDELKRKLLQARLIGIRLDGNGRYKEYQYDMKRLQKRWKEFFILIQKNT